MNIIDPLVMEYQHESSVTRKVLERIPFDDPGWKPHAKSFSMVDLASHVANLQQWAGSICAVDEFLFDPATFVPWIAKNSNDLLSTFDKNVAATVAAMKGVDNAAAMRTWRMVAPDGSVFFEMPRIAVLRGMVHNHTIHHRGQLSVYLRMRDVPVPSIYGPSADDPGR